MKKLYQAKDRIEAQLLKDYLAERHIDTLTRGDYLSGAAGELPALQFPELWVLEDRDLELARRLVEEYFSAGDVSERWRCPRCGEISEGQFQICWNCGSVRE